VRTDRHAALGGHRTDPAHDRRIAGVETAGDVGAAHDCQQRLVIAEGPTAESLTQVGVEIDRQLSR
jgi:hypothetical protein